jgi:hypothetical protein
MLDKNNPTSLVPDLWPTIEKLILNFDQFDSSRNHFLRTKRVGVSSLTNFWCLSSDLIHRVGKINQIFKDKSELNRNIKFPISDVDLIGHLFLTFESVFLRTCVSTQSNSAGISTMGHQSPMTLDTFKKSNPWSKLKTFLEDEHNTANYYSAFRMGESSSHRVCERVSSAGISEISEIFSHNHSLGEI